MLGPASWAAVSARLRARGAEAVVARYAIDDPPSYEGAALQIAECAAGPGWTLALHSGAGALASLVVDAGRGIERCVFVDAILPHPGRSWSETAPLALVERLQREALGGRAPAWNTWFRSDPLAALDADARASIEGELPRPPLAWFTLSAPAGAAANVPWAYLQLSPGYAAEAAACEAAGWPVRRLDLGHLGIVTHADMVAAELLSLTP